MEKREVFKNFSLKGLFLTIFKTTVITVFIGFTLAFLYSIPKLINGKMLFDIESNNIIAPYIGIFVLVYVVNLIKQKRLANKLNK